MLLAPDSRGPTWDVLLDDFGPDVAFVQRALDDVGARVAIDPARVFVGGFSDGASYALTLGHANGDLFDAIGAFSPGFMAPPALRGAPRVFVSHGTRDRVLDVAACSRTLVRRLRALDRPARYVEFDGPHAVPAHVAREALDWMLQREGRAGRG